MKKYNVYFSFANSFSITFQEDEKPSIIYRSNSKNLLIKEIKTKSSSFNITDSFTLATNSFSSLEDLLDHLLTKGDNIRFIKNIKTEQKVLGEEECNKCGGSGDSDVRDVTGDYKICPKCDGPGTVKVWG